MGQTMQGIYADKRRPGTWQVDKWQHGQRLRQRGFPNFEDAQRWLIQQLNGLREMVVHGERPKRTFAEAAAHYILEERRAGKVSLSTEISLLKGLMAYIGELELPQIHDATLKPYVEARRAKGRKHKTINLALGVVRHILRLAAMSWRHENGMTWLAQAPMVTLLPLTGFQRPPRPIGWSEQRRLMPKLPAHLARMALFILNTAVRDDVVCNLRWEWEIQVPELGISIFDVPAEHVKGRMQSRVLVCNSVAQSIIESVRGMHDEFVFVYRRERTRRTHLPPKMPYHPIGTMNNTAWQRARKSADLGDLHVHDLRHTAGMRLREAGVGQETISDLFWHRKASMTEHYSLAQLVELHGALERIKADNGTWNKSLATLRLEHRAARAGNAYPPVADQVSPPKVPPQRKTA